MRFLKTLQLNCVLAPAVVVALAVVVLACSWRAQFDERRAGERAGLLSAISALTLLEALDQDAALDALREANPAWTGLALVEMRDERVQIMAASGRLRIDPRDPDRGLLAALAAPSAWGAGPQWLAAAKVPGSATRLVYGEQPRSPVSTLPLAIGVFVLVTVGGFLAWYLARRIWRPIADVTEQTEAALAGRPVRVTSVLSDESLAYRSTLAQLVERSRSGAPTVVTSAPPSP